MKSVMKELADYLAAEDYAHPTSTTGKTRYVLVDPIDGASSPLDLRRNGRPTTEVVLTLVPVPEGDTDPNYHWIDDIPVRIYIRTDSPLRAEKTYRELNELLNGKEAFDMGDIRVLRCLRRSGYERLEGDVVEHGAIATCVYTFRVRVEQLTA